MAEQQAKRVTELLQATEAAKLETTKHANTAARLYRLKTNDDFVWFLKDFVQPLIDAEDKILNDRKTTDRERADACHRKDIANTIKSLADAKHREFQAKANPTIPTP